MTLTYKISPKKYKEIHHQDQSKIFLLLWLYPTFFGSPLFARPVNHFQIIKLIFIDLTKPIPHRFPTGKVNLIWKISLGRVWTYINVAIFLPLLSSKVKKEIKFIKNLPSWHGPGDILWFSIISKVSDLLLDHGANILPLSSTIYT